MPSPMRLEFRTRQRRSELRTLEGRAMAHDTGLRVGRLASRALLSRDGGQGAITREKILCNDVGAHERQHEASDS